MTASTEEIRRQLEESARVKRAFSDELIGRILQFTQRCAAALRGGGKIVFFGKSANIVRGLEAGRGRGAYLAALTGETGGALAGKVDLLLNVPSRDPQRIQEAHITIGHIACSLIEQLAAQG